MSVLSNDVPKIDASAQRWLGLLANEYAIDAAERILVIAEALYCGNHQKLTKDNIASKYALLDKWAAIFGFTADELISRFADGLRSEMGSNAPKDLPELFQTFFINLAAEPRQ